MGVWIRTTTTVGISRILEAIGKQRWYFFKNKPQVVMDRNTGILWVDHTRLETAGGGIGAEHAFNENYSAILELDIGGYQGWDLPTANQFIEMSTDRTFPFMKDGGINGHLYWRIKDQVGKSIRCFTNKIDNYYSYWLPCNQVLVTQEYLEKIDLKNTTIREPERWLATLNLFFKNDLEPIFTDDSITELFKQARQKSENQEEISQKQTQIANELLSLTFAYHDNLTQDEQAGIAGSPIKYYRALAPLLDRLLEKLDDYEEINSDLLQEISVIGYKLPRYAEEDENFSEAEKEILRALYRFFLKQLDLGLNRLREMLMTLQQETAGFETRLEGICAGAQMLRELAILEKEERPTLAFVLENIDLIIRNTVSKLVAMRLNQEFAALAVDRWNAWNQDYLRFKTELKKEFNDLAAKRGIEPTVASLWYADWQKKRLKVEAGFLPLIEHGFRLGSVPRAEANAPAQSGNPAQVAETVLTLLETYRAGIDTFYLDKRIEDYQKFIALPDGSIQEQLAAESALFELLVTLQAPLQELIFSVESSEERQFLVNWLNALQRSAVDEVLGYIAEKGLWNISLEILTGLTELKRRNLIPHLADRQAFAQELEGLNEEYQALISKIRSGITA